MLVVGGNVLFTILNRGQSDYFVEIARQCGVGGATVFPAKGTATNAVLRMLGLGDTNKDIVMIVAERKILDQVSLRAKEDSKINGVCAVFGVSEVNKMKSAWKMITVIVNSGFAEEVMEAARKAGASGGTISHARGTASKEHEEHFMGITIVPEKEMIYILCETEKSEAIVKAISSMDCLKEPGMGIVFTQDVVDFQNLGSNK